MITKIYIEKHLQNNPQTQEIIKKLPNLPVFYIDSYLSILNRGYHDYWQEKEKQALILATKKGSLVKATPANYGLSQHSYYFVAGIGCPFDCTYCYLKGYFPTAHLFLFLNFEEIWTAIEEKITEHSFLQTPLWFYSGEFMDSLALDNLHNLSSFFIDKFRPYSKQNVFLELRTKSTNISNLLKMKACSNVIPAFTLSPQNTSTDFELKTASLNKRLGVINKLIDHGWTVWLRLDPILLTSNYQTEYLDFLDYIFQRISNLEKIHSIDIGFFRLSNEAYKSFADSQNIKQLDNLKRHPDKKLFAYPAQKTANFYQIITKKLKEKGIPANKISRCME